MYNTLGQQVFKKENVNPKNFQFQIEQSAGIYTLEVNIENELRHYQIVKE